MRDRLIAKGLNLSKYKQPLVPIHNTLKRLESQQEIVPFLDDNGEIRGYRWVSPIARAVAEVERPRMTSYLGFKRGSLAELMNAQIEKK